MSARLCEQCEAPLDRGDDGVLRCPACLTAYDGEALSDTIIEEDLALSDVLRMVNEAQR